MKKKVCLVILILIAIVIGAVSLPSQKDYDYLRIHIRANSNSSVDQSVKYEIKDEMVKILTPKLCNVPSKDEAVKIVGEYKNYLTNHISSYLKEKGFNYSVNIKIDNEYFPTRTYQSTTLESGYYDAVIVELGDALGDNWWCIMYPPLCFVNKNESNMQIKYKSKIFEWIKSIFNH